MWNHHPPDLAPKGNKRAKSREREEEKNEGNAFNAGESVRARESAEMFPGSCLWDQDACYH